jgi:hypothetical protein
VSEIIPEIISGFAGAFFAFLFMRLADTGKSIVDRQNRHFRALGRLEILFGDLSTAIQNNQYELEHFLNAFELLQHSKRVIMTPNRAQPLEFRDDAFDGLGNEDLLNEIMSYRALSRSLSRDINTLWETHDKFRDMAFSNSERLQDYIDNFAQCAETARLLKAAHAQLMQRTLRILVIIRILYRRDRTMLHRLVSRGIRLHYPKRIEEQITAESRRMQLEIDKSQQESSERISEMLREQGASADAQKSRG